MPLVIPVFGIALSVILSTSFCYDILFFRWPACTREADVSRELDAPTLSFRDGNTCKEIADTSCIGIMLKIIVNKLCIQQAVLSLFSHKYTSHLSLWFEEPRSFRSTKSTCASAYCFVDEL